MAKTEGALLIIPKEGGEWVRVGDGILMLKRNEKRLGKEKHSNYLPRHNTFN